MSDTSLLTLRRLLLEHYEDFKLRLTRRLGSAELAGDALQETWLRLERGEGIAGVRSHEAYLYRIACNLARDRLRADNRRLTTTEVAALLAVKDDAPDPARTVEARSDLRALKAIVLELPARQRAILLAARVAGWPRQKIAEHYKISQRLVQRELQEAQDYCAARLKRPKKRFTQGPAETSYGQEQGDRDWNLKK
jgi:RNA polymerase sigma factor (sigma-70 family)